MTYLKKSMSFRTMSYDAMIRLCFGTSVWSLHVYKGGREKGKEGKRERERERERQRQRERERQRQRERERQRQRQREEKIQIFIYLLQFM